MSVVNTIFAQGETALLASGHSDVFIALSGVEINKKFTGRLDVQASFNFEALLGSDKRMQNMARFLPENAPNFSRGDLFAVDGMSGIRWRVVDRENNANSVTVDFNVEQIS